MPVVLNARPDHGFDEPLGLMADCHRRIERFLNGLARLAQEAELPLPEGRRGPLETALRYFREAAPRHTADEEESLFPRLLASGDERARAAAEAMRRLQEQHAEADRLHREVDRLGQAWLGRGRLSADEAAELRSMLARLATLYEEHIAVEEHCVFPLAASVLEESDLRAIGEEMAVRRGLPPRLAAIEETE